MVLEYGCGDGLNTPARARRGARVKALDISPELVEVARQRLRVNRADKDVELIIGSAHDLPLEDESVDVSPFERPLSDRELAEYAE